MKTYSLLALFTAPGLLGCGDSGGTTASAGGSAGAGSGGTSSGGSSSKASGGASSGGASSGGASSGGAGGGGAGSGGSAGKGSGGSAVGGSGGISGVGPAICDIPESSSCVAYARYPTAPEIFAQQCDVDGGTIVEMCPDGATARCDITTDTIEMIQYWYYTDVDTLMTLEMNCGLMGGMWSVP